MKTKITKKDLRKEYDNLIQVNYCKLQTLLKYRDPDYYIGSNQYGWYADVYTVGYNAIVTGYQPIGNIKPDYDYINQFECAAKNIIDQELSEELTKSELNMLIDRFIRGCL